MVWTIKSADTEAQADLKIVAALAKALQGFISVSVDLVFVSAVELHI